MTASFTVRTTRSRRAQKAIGYIWVGAKPRPGDAVDLFCFEDQQSQPGIFVRWNRQGNAIVRTAGFR